MRADIMAISWQRALGAWDGDRQCRAQSQMRSQMRLLSPGTVSHGNLPWRRPRYCTCLSGLSGCHLVR